VRSAIPSTFSAAPLPQRRRPGRRLVQRERSSEPLTFALSLQWYRARDCPFRKDAGGACAGASVPQSRGGLCGEGNRCTAESHPELAPVWWARYLLFLLLFLLTSPTAIGRKAGGGRSDANACACLDAWKPTIGLHRWELPAGLGSCRTTGAPLARRGPRPRFFFRRGARGAGPSPGRPSGRPVPAAALPAPSARLHFPFGSIRYHAVAQKRKKKEKSTSILDAQRTLRPYVILSAAVARRGSYGFTYGPASLLNSDRH